MTDAAATSPFRCAVLVPVGPSPRDAERVEDLFASLQRYEPEVGPVFILNDGGDAEKLVHLAARRGFHAVVLRHPRGGIGNAWMGRLTFGLASAYRHIATQAPRHHVLRLDTDALVVAPFVAGLGELVRASPQAGLIGSVELTADGRRNSGWFRQRVYRMSRLIARWDCPPYIRMSFTGTNARFRRLIRRAYAHGYVAGYAPCGGAYLLTAEAVQRLAGMPELRDDRLVANDIMTEDIFFSIAVHAVGLKVVEQNSSGDFFGVCWKGLPGHSLEEVAERGHAIIHSVKDHGPFKEAETRAYFRAQRSALLAQRSRSTFSMT